MVCHSVDGMLGWGSVGGILYVVGCVYEVVGLGGGID